MSQKPLVNMVRNSDIGVIHLNSDSSMTGSDTANTPVTPLSPGSKYSRSTLYGMPDGVFSSIVLSLWDNILGPRVKHVWNVDGCTSPGSDLFTHITGQVLSSEICRDLYTSVIDYKFYNLPHKGVIVPAFVFSAKGSCGLVVHSLSIVMPMAVLQFYLEIHDVLLCCFQRLAGKLRVILDRNAFDVSMEVFSTYLSSCVRFLCRVHTSSLATGIQLSDTAFSPDHVLEREFMARCIASHLMTGGRTLVIGETADRINLVLYTLSFFNSQSERRCSLPVCVKNPQPYHHDFFLQGLIKDRAKPYLPMTEIFASRYPTTVVDLTTREVKQTAAHNEHVLHRYETLKNELICLQYGHFEKLVVLDQVLYPISAYPATLVEIFLKEIFDLPDTCCCVREAYITQFLRMLYKKAQCLIECVKAESCEGEQLLRPSVLRRLRNDLHLNFEGDYRIVLATAEKLKPGIYTLLVGNRKSDREQIKNVEVY